MVPVPAPRVTACALSAAPSRGELKTIFWFPAAELTVAAAEIVATPPIVIIPFVVVMLDERLTAPLVANVVPARIFAPLAVVKVPLFVIAIAPVAVKVLFTATATPFRQQIQQ